MKPIVIALITLIAALLCPPPATAQNAPCEPGRGPGVPVDEIRELLEAGQPVELPQGASILGTIDRSVLCPGVQDESIPCIVPAPLNLACTQVVAPLALRNIVIDGELELSGADLAGGLSLEASEVLGDLVLSGARIGGDLVLDRVLVNGSLLLDGARVEGRLQGGGVRCLGALSLDRSRVARGVEIRGMAIGGDALLGVESGGALTLAKGTVLGSASLRGVRLGGPLSVEEMTFAAMLEGEEVDVGGEAKLARLAAQDGLLLAGTFRDDLVIEDLSTAAELSLSGARVTGNVTLLRAMLGGSVEAADLQVGKTLRLEASDIEGGVELDGSTIAGELVLISSRFGGTVEIGDARLTARPRAVACTPANPFGEEDETLELDEDAGSEPDEE